MPWRNAEPQPIKAQGRKGCNERLGAGHLTFPLSHRETKQLQKSWYTGPGWWNSDLLTSHWLAGRRKLATVSRSHVEECKERWATPACSTFIHLFLLPVADMFFPPSGLRCLATYALPFHFFFSWLHLVRIFYNWLSDSLDAVFLIKKWILMRMYFFT